MNLCKFTSEYVEHFWKFNESLSYMFFVTEFIGLTNTNEFVVIVLEDKRETKKL